MRSTYVCISGSRRPWGDGRCGGYYLAVPSVCFEYWKVGWYVVSRCVRLFLSEEDGFAGCRVGRRG